MDYYRASVIVLSSVLGVMAATQTELEGAVLMTLYEDEIEAHDHREVVLHCTVKYPGTSKEACQQITWTHEIDKATHEEVTVKSCDVYRVNTELVQYTSHLEILSITGRVKGWYKCKAECGGNFYTVGCKVEDLLLINSSFLCSKRTFPATTMIITDGSSLYIGRGEGKIMLSVIVIAVVVVAILLTTALRWFVRRRSVRRRRLLALQEIAQSLQDTEIASANRSPPGTDVRQHRPRPEACRGARHSNRYQPMPTNPVLFQRMPDGSSYVFVPLLSLPSYETALKESQDTQCKPNTEGNPILLPGTFTIPLGADSYSSYSSGGSTPLSVSSPPSYRSVESFTLTPTDEELDGHPCPAPQLKQTRPSSYQPQ